MIDGAQISGTAPLVNARAVGREAATPRRGLAYLAEAIALALVCLSPWAMGAVDARSGLTMMVGIALLTLLGIVAGPGTHRTRDLFCLPSLALGGLALLATIHAVALPSGLFRIIAPAEASLREQLLPDRPERVIGDEAGLVGLSPATISQAPDSSIAAATWLLAGWVLFQGILGLDGGVRTLRRFSLAIAINASILSLFSIVQALSWDGKIYWTIESSSASSAGPFVCHNHLAAYLNIGLGSALGFLLARSRAGLGGPRLWAAYAAAVVVVGVFVSQSRGGFIAMAAAAVVTVALARPGRARLGIGLAVMASAVGLFLLAQGSSSPFSRVGTLLESHGYRSRFEVWGAGLRAWSAHPVWGNGLGTYATSVVPFGVRDRGVFNTHAENEYVQILAEGGVIGLGLVVLGLTGVARLTASALRATKSSDDRALVAGAFFGVVALAVHNAGDFNAHIPAVAVSGVILCAYLCRLGLDAQVSTGTVCPDRTPTRRIGSRLAIVGGACILLALLPRSVALVRAETLMAGAGIPPPESELPAVGLSVESRRILERDRAALESILRLLPDWAEGHLRLGTTLLSLYQKEAESLLGDAVKDPTQRRAMSDPLWLHRLVHATPADRRPSPESLLAHPPVRLYLVPAARSFLEARRCCPVVALAHAELASLDYLLDGPDRSTDYAERAFQLAGHQGRLLDFVGIVSAQAGDPALAARVWRRSLEIRDRGWPDIADLAGAALPPDEILDRVISRGRHALEFAERLYASPDKKEVRERFLRVAVERLPGEDGLVPAERLHLEARAWAGLGNRVKAREKLDEALGMEPTNTPWRVELVDWLIGWGDRQGAHDQALVGLQLAPGDPEAKRALDRASEVLAREGSSP